MPGQLEKDVQAWRVGNSWPLRAPYLMGYVLGGWLYPGPHFTAGRRGEAEQQEKQLVGTGRGFDREASDPGP